MSSTGIYWGGTVTFSHAFTTYVIPLSNINWGFTQDWYSGNSNATWKLVTDVAAAPYDVQLTSMGLPSYSSHYWIAIGK